MAIDPGQEQQMSDPVRIAAGEFKTRCLKLLDEVAETGDDLIVTKRGRPVARLVPMPAETCELFGALGGSVVREDDIVAPVDETWDAAR